MRMIRVSSWHSNQYGWESEVKGPHSIYITPEDFISSFTPAVSAFHYLLPAATACRHAGEAYIKSDLN